MYNNVECSSSKEKKRRVIVWGKMENPRPSVNLNHIFIYLILTTLLSLYSTLTIYSNLNTYYNPHNSICVFNWTCSLQCWSNSNFVSPPTTGTGTSLDPNPRLYQVPREIKYPEVQTSSQVLHSMCFSRRGLHLGRFDPSRRWIEPRIWI